MSSAFSQGHALSRRDRLQLRGKGFHGQAPEVEPLAASDDGDGHLLRLGRRQHEPHPLRRLFENLKQRVEGRGRQPLRLVDDVDLLAPLHRSGRGLLAQFAGVLNSAVRGCVDLDHVQVGALTDRNALRAHPTGLGRGPVLAIDHLGQDPRGGGLARAARAAEQERVVKSTFADGARERPNDVLLPQHVGRSLRPIPPVKSLVLLFLRQHVPSTR